MARKHEPYEEHGSFYVGRVGNGERTTRVLCFRHHATSATGASRRFSRKEAFRRCMRSLRGKAPEEITGNTVKATVVASA